MGGKSSKPQVTTQEQVLDPSVRRAVDFLVNQSIGLGGGAPGPTRGIGGGELPTGGLSGLFGRFTERLGVPGPIGGFGGGTFDFGGGEQPSLAPDLSPDTLRGLGLLRSQFDDNIGADVLEQAVRGDFINPALGGVTQNITDAAIRAVGDRFSQAGRTGSPGEGLAIAGEVSRNLAPFAFGAFEAERGRQLGAIPQLFGQQGQAAQNLLNVGQTLEEQERLQALEPFQRLQLLSGPLATAISGAPPTQRITQPTSRNALAGGLGGALSGAQLGGIVPGLGTGIGAGIGGLIGLLGI